MPLLLLLHQSLPKNAPPPDLILLQDMRHGMKSLPVPSDRPINNNCGFLSCRDERPTMTNAMTPPSGNFTDPTASAVGPHNHSKTIHQSNSRNIGNMDESITTTSDTSRNASKIFSSSSSSVDKANFDSNLSTESTTTTTAASATNFTNSVPTTATNSHTNTTQTMSTTKPKTRPRKNSTTAFSSRSRRRRRSKRMNHRRIGGDDTRHSGSSGASNANGSNNNHSSSSNRNLCKFDQNCKDRFCLWRHSSRAVCPYADLCDHPACSFYHQGKLRCPLDLRCNNPHCDKKHSLSVIKLSVRNVYDPLEFWFKADPQGNNARYFVDSFIMELVKELRRHLSIELDAKRHFPHLYSGDTNHFYWNGDLQYIYLCGLRGEEKLRVEKFFMEHGIHLKGTRGVVYCASPASRASARVQSTARGGDSPVAALPDPSLTDTNAAKTAADTKPSDTSTIIEPEDSSYFASFLIPYRIVNYNLGVQDTDIHFLFSMQWQKKSKNYVWQFCGGKSTFDDYDSVDTALREFTHQTLHQIPPHLLHTLEKWMRDENFSFRCQSGSVQYYFIPDFIIRDQLLEEITQMASEVPTEAQQIAKWRETYGNDFEAFEQAIQRGQVDFSFSAPKKFCWATHDEVQESRKSMSSSSSSNEMNRLSQCTDPQELIPENCSFLKTAYRILTIMERPRNKKRLVKIWNLARRSNYGFMEGKIGTELLAQSTCSDLSEEDLSLLSGEEEFSSQHRHLVDNDDVIWSDFIPRSFWSKVVVGAVGLGIPALTAAAWIYWSFRSSSKSNTAVKTVQQAG